MISIDVLDALTTTVFHEFADEEEALGIGLADFVSGLDDHEATRLVDSLNSLAASDGDQRAALLAAFSFAWQFDSGEDEAGFLSALAEVVAAIRDDTDLA